MNIFREGKLRNSDVATGDILSVELRESDIEALTTVRYTMNRFSQFRQQRLGWDQLDKAHVYLRAPEEIPDPSDESVTLQLDPGGDLYFTIWENQALREARPCQQFPREQILQSDPSGTLVRLGIEVVRFYGLSNLAGELYRPKFSSA
jgi:hypothetical protein